MRIYFGDATLVAAADLAGHHGVGALLESCLADKRAFAPKPAIIHKPITYRVHAPALVRRRHRPCRRRDRLAALRFDSSQYTGGNSDSHPPFTRHPARLKSKPLTGDSQSAPGDRSASSFLSSARAVAVTPTTRLTPPRNASVSRQA